MANISFASVTKKFGRNIAVDGLSLDVGDGEFFVLLGPTGAGKTTALRLIAGLEQPDAGQVEIAGQDVREWTSAERDVALVFQYYSLYPRYTVRQNLEFPLRSRTRNFSQAGWSSGKVAPMMRPARNCMIWNGTPMTARSVQR